MAGSPPRSHFLLVVALPLAVYAISLGNDFHYDDGHSILRNPHIRTLGGLQRFFTDPTTFSGNPDYAMYRPLVVSTHAFNYAIGGYRPAGYIAFNLAVHLANCVLVLLLLRRLGLGNGAALWGGLAFSLFPPHSETVNYISSRSESLAALFFLIALLSYLQDLEKKWSRPRITALLSFTAALLCKATALSLPLVLVCYEFIFYRSSRSADRLSRLWPFFFLSLTYVVIYNATSPASLEASFSTRPWLLHLATQTKALVHYLFLAIFPVHLNVHPQFFVARSLLAPPVLLGAFMLLSIGWLACKQSSWRWGLGFFFLCLSPTLAVPLNILVNDHRLYLASIGLVFLAAPLSNKRWIAVLVLVLFAVLSLQRSLDWRDETTLWRQAATASPLMPEAQYNLGRALHQDQDLAGARSAYRRALELEPNYYLAMANLGALARQQGRPTESVDLLQRSLRLVPSSVEALNNLGLAYADLGQTEAALTAYHRAIELADDRGEIWYNLGLALRNAGRMTEARESLLRAVELEPKLKERFNPK